MARGFFAQRSASTKPLTRQMELLPHPGAFFFNRNASRLLQSRGVTGVDIPLHDTTATTRPSSRASPGVAGCIG